MKCYYMCAKKEREGGGVPLVSFVYFIHLSVPIALFLNPLLPSVVADVDNLTFSVSWF